MNRKTIKEWQEIIREWAHGKGFDWSEDDLDTMLLRLHSEVTEAGEAWRDRDMSHVAEELADVAIRLFDTCEVLGIDLEIEIEKKHNINIDRPHKHGRAER